MFHMSKELQCQILAAIPGFLNDFIAGLGYGWVAPTLALLQNDTDIGLSPTIEESSWIASLHDFGRLIGTLVISYVLNIIGRKGILVITSITYLFVWLTIAFTRSIPVICFVRLIFGIMVGFFDVTFSIYLCEAFKPALRCAFGSITVASFYGGYLFEFCVVNYFSYGTVPYINCAVALVAIFANFWAVETPEYLIMKGKYELALKNFLWLRGKEDVTAEFESLKQHIESEKKRKRTIIAFFSVPIYRKAITLVVVFSLLTIATGASSLSSFVSIAFTADSLTPNEYTMLFGACQFVSVAFGSTIIEKINRRTILICSLLIATLMHASTATLFYVQNSHIYAIPYFSWWIFATITAYSMMYSSGVHPVICAARGELLPQYVRPFGGAVALMGHSLISFLCTKTFLLVTNAFGIYWNFIFYSLMSLICMVFVYFILPETRGKTLMEIQNAIELKMIQ